jgi:hypothetical protein
MIIMTRRDFFVSLAATVAGLMLPSLGLTAGQVSGSQVDGLLNILVPDLTAAGRLGRFYLTAYPAELDFDRLADGALGPFRLHAAADAIDSTPESVLISRAKRIVADDYIAGRVVDIDGWVLSITEARFYALAALADGNLR